LRLLHIDVCESMLIESIGGSRYTLLIVDYSGMYFIYFLKNKSDVLHMFFIIFKEKCNNVLDRKIKYIRIDNDREFINNENF